MKILSEYKNICCVYCIKNKVTNMNYFGSTQNLQKRLHVHRSALRRLKHESKLMNLHYSSYGEDSFEISIIKKYTSKFPNVVFEDKLIRSHKNVYNTKHLRYDISRQGFRDLISTQIKNEEDLKTQISKVVCEKYCDEI